ncbi:MAG: ABC transporter ATP-binding protein/permease [bacterium]|nr:ABC transporter ATP-binding protein/permease [bacterium]
MINVSNLNKYYNKGKSNEIHVINNTNLVLPNTGFVVFLGASGSGKTTLINVIAGLDKAKGEISYDDATFKNYKARKIDKFRRENIGYVFQNYNLLPNVTVYENLRLTLELMGITDGAEVKERIEYVLDMLKMKRFKNKLASNLSGGQMQRVSIARALVKDSKIIIADEPTGNLDSENTIEVMNILKAISKDRLVIMVTHDKKSANFYADRIVEIKDGSIIEDYENNSSDDLENYDKTKIYLKDLKNQVIELGNVKVNLYLEENDSLEDLDLTIVKKDGQIYLKSNQIKYLDDDSKVKLIDGNYQSIKKEDIKNFEFNPKPFSDKKKKFSLMPLLHSFRDAYRTHRASSKKMKGLHACFVIIGVVMAVCVLMLSVGTYVEGDQIDYADTGVVYKRGEVKDYTKEVEKLINEGLIIDYTSATSLYYHSNIAGNVALTNTCYEFDSKYINDDVICGTKECNKGETVITKRIADGIIKKMSNIEKLTYDSLLGKNANGCTIVGIVNSEATTYYTNYGASQYDSIFDCYSVYESIENYNNFDYKLVGGRDIEDPTSECLMNFETYFREFSRADNIEEIEIDGKTLKIVGLFSAKNSEYEPFLLVDDNDLVKRNISNVEYRYSLVPSSLLTLVSGHMPTGSKEIIVSDRYYEVKGEGVNQEIDQLIADNNYEIVGYFKTDKATRSITAIGIDDKYMLYSNLKYPSNDKVLITTNDQEVIKRFKEINTTFKTSYELEHELRVRQKAEMFASTITVSLVFLIITVIYTFFMMRSKMIHRIYEIGVLREIGASKGRIYRMFLVELIVLMCMTTLIGYVASLLLCHFANMKIHGLLNLFRYSPIYAIAGFVILVGVSIISGMLPIFMLQRKTPSEIVSKYDL